MSSQERVLRLYNTFTKREEEFHPREEGKVRMYTCGPTVYGRPHIGNYSSFLAADLLRRWLTVSGYAVTHVKNITDVGHLVADGDQGEDKVEKEARRIAAEKRGADAKVTMEDVLGVATMYTEQYLEDERTLCLLEPHHRPRATETIPEMIALIEVLIRREHAYETDDGVYFAVETFPAYGKLSGNTLGNLDAGARVDVKERKKHPADFALWKKCVGENARHVLRWASPWGEGFPGWHIECSAMSTKFLGEQIDIHTGGEDNIFPHHECEIAQSECASGKPFVRAWLHRRRIDLGNQKMSKSLGNVFTIPDIVQKGYSPLDLRYYFLSVHYRTHLKFTEKGLAAAHTARRRILEWMEEAASWHPAADAVLAPGEVSAWTEKFTAAMNADLNTPAALAVIFDAASWSRTRDAWSTDALDALAGFISMVRETFGCFDEQTLHDIPSDVSALVTEREEARRRGDFQTSDRLRKKIQSLGYEVKDLPGGSHVSRI